MMEEIKIAEINNISDFVNSMRVNTKYILPETLRYKWMIIEEGKEYYSNGTYFTWVMEYNFKIAGTTGYIYPLAGSNMVKHFKTESGAKRNFLKTYAKYFSEL